MKDPAAALREAQSTFAALISLHQHPPTRVNQGYKALLSRARELLAGANDAADKKSRVTAQKVHGAQPHDRNQAP